MEEKTQILDKGTSLIDVHGNYTQGWERIGFHRAIAGFFVNYVPALLMAILFIFVSGMLIPSLLPYPDATGYYEVTKSMYALMFMLFDAGVGSALGRFVPEYRVKDPKRALQYISFFIWFQMFTGLVQVTAISIFVLYWLPNLTTAHLAWVFLVYSTIQYPGMLSVLDSVLKSFQHYGKYIVVKVFQDVFQFGTQIIFILLGRWWGASNPAVGELVGMSVGLVLGLYIDDFLAFILAAKLFDKILKGIGLSIGSCIRPTFCRAIAIQSLKYGLKTMPAGIYGNVLGFVSFLVTFSILPQYAAWMGMISLAKNFTGMIDLPGTIKSNTEYSISESMNNGKRNLSHYYMALELKWRFFLTTYLWITIIIMIPIALGTMLSVFGENWLPALGLIPLLSIPEVIKIFEKPVSFTQVNHPGYDQAIGLVQSTVSFLWYMFLIYVVNVNLTITIFILKDIPILLAFMALNWIVLHVKILRVRLRDFAMQSFVLPLLPMAIYAGFCWLFGTYVFPLGAALVGAIPFAVITIAMVLFLWPILIVCPLMGIFGAWDDYSVDSFRLTVELSGPSKFMMRLMYKASLLMFNISPLKGRFPIKGSEIATKEALELEEFKRSHDVKNVKEIVNR
nr:hypothetical protein [Candidatus Sigynarchaeum springense]MDO8118621.1 hypothetical protein [Candidatus Sigynarchaeota archaeon]